VQCEADTSARAWSFGQQHHQLRVMSHGLSFALNIVELVELAAC